MIKSRCAVCLTCVRVCPYGVPVINQEAHAAYIDPAKCQGCGVCVAECPHKAIQLMHDRDEQVLSEISAISMVGEEALESPETLFSSGPEAEAAAAP